MKWQEFERADLQVKLQQELIVTRAEARAAYPLMVETDSPEDLEDDDDSEESLNEEEDEWDWDWNDDEDEPEFD